MDPSQGPRGQLMAPEVLAGALKARRLFLFLDYDGTLMPFSGDPGRVVPDGELLGLLAALLQKPGWKVGIVSGRALEDLRRLFPVSGFFLVGSHGAEIQDGQGQVLRSDDPAEFRRLLGGIREALKDVDLGEGVLLEEKPYALALHYRQAPEGLPSESLDAFRRACQPAVERGILQWLWGDQVVEVRTARAHKGTAVDQILAQQPPGVHPVYLGDDATDEDAFRALQGRGTTVRVGAEDRATQARYQFRNVSEVRRFLKAVVD